MPKINYQICANWEWTSKCNARCVMCPQDQIERPLIMSQDTAKTVLERLEPASLYRVVIAGYGEPTTHPQFFPMIDALRDCSHRFDMVSNGQLLDLDKIRHVDGVLHTLIVSFSSIVPEVYAQVHVGLDLERVKNNILTAQRHLKKTRLVISLTPLAECLDHLGETVAWLRNNGVQHLSMSPSLYNRAGSLSAHKTATSLLRKQIRKYGLHSQEFDFVPSLSDIIRQYRANRFHCVPRNVDLFIASSGDYLYCYNDIAHRHPLGSVQQLSVEQALAMRQSLPAIPSLCAECNMRDRYGAMECGEVALRLASRKLAAFALEAQRRLPKVVPKL